MTKEEQILDFIGIKKGKDTTKLSFRGKHYDHLVARIKDILAGKEVGQKYSVYGGVVEDADKFGMRIEVEKKEVVERVKKEIEKAEKPKKKTSKKKK